MRKSGAYLCMPQLARLSVKGSLPCRWPGLLTAVIAQTRFKSSAELAATLLAYYAHTTIKSLSAPSITRRPYRLSNRGATVNRNGFESGFMTFLVLALKALSKLAATHCNI